MIEITGTIDQCVNVLYINSNTLAWAHTISDQNKLPILTIFKKLILFKKLPLILNFQVRTQPLSI